KRPRSTLSVGMALRDGKPYMSWGTPGGDQQDPWSCQMVMRHVSRKSSRPRMNLQEAIDAPAWHIEHFPLSFWPRTARPGVLVVVGRLPTANIKELERRGHKVGARADGPRQGFEGPRQEGGGAPRWAVGPRQPGRPGRLPPQSRRQRARHAGV